ncbi:hypothetical protein DPMN_172960 [Dreissena polymorpha]|uniref:Uncharacterized protein n=1 Tax=Dreissena polymorpha TaxID=45954 RepID=A0A9D4IFM8_DREPO|nr:hypothetical protein DPMN_172960 [Dreissena polymorpha]
MNLLTKFHEDWTINVASRVLTRKNAPPPGGHVFQPTGIIFKLFHDIIGMNLLTIFHEDWKQMWPLEKKAPPLGSHVFQAKVTIFKLIQDIIGTNLLSKFHEDRKINVTSRVLTRFYYSHIWKCPAPWWPYIIGMNLLTKFHEDQTINEKCPALGSHIFQANTNLLTNFNEDWTINVASRVLTRQMLTSYDGRRTTDKSSP